MREILLVVAVCVLVYIGVATIVPNASFVGSYGGVLGWYNTRLFGYASYFYPFILLYPIKGNTISDERTLLLSS